MAMDLGWAWLVNHPWAALVDVWKVLFALASLVAVYVGIANFITARRAHLIDVFDRTYDLVDTPEIRSGRQYIYSIAGNPQTFADEDWIPNQKPGGHPDAFASNRAKVEAVARAYDKLGLLVWEGRVPVNLIARFHAAPALKCWVILAPYISALRRHRKQRGHFWEWENLVYGIIIPGLTGNDGIWEGVLQHDDLADLVAEAETRRADMHRDVDYKPRSTSGRLAACGISENGEAARCGLSNRDRTPPCCALSDRQR